MPDKNKPVNAGGRRELGNPKLADRGRKTVLRKPKLNCDKCVIEQINAAKFKNTRQAVSFNVKENKKEFVITAIPSIKGCPCVWSNFRLEYSIILTGKKDIKRSSIFSSLNETVTVNPSRNKNYFTIKGCTLTVKVSKLNDDLRNGNIRGARAFRNVLVPLRLAGRVKCGKKWRTFQIVFLDK